MRSPSPAFSFYPKDWLADGPVRELSYEQKGVYADLLSIYWLEGGLPADTARLARLVGMPAKKFSRLWPDIERCFRIEGDRIVQKRLEEEKAKQLAFRQRQAVKGAKGGKSKHINKDRKPRLTRGLPRAKPDDTLPSPSPSPFPTPTTNSNGNEPAPAAAVALPAVIATVEKLWSTEACDDWQHHLGTPPGGRIGAALKPLLAKHGWGVVRPLWREACERAAAESDPSYFTPEVFARTFQARLGAPKGRAHGPPGIIERGAVEARKFLESRKGRQ